MAGMLYIGYTDKYGQTDIQHNIHMRIRYRYRRYGETQGFFTIPSFNKTRICNWKVFNAICNPKDTED